MKCNRNPKVQVLGSVIQNVYERILTSETEDNYQRHVITSENGNPEARLQGKETDVVMKAVFLQQLAK